jgi:hypothetical protein
MDHLSRLSTNAIYAWYQYLEATWPYVGAVFSLTIWTAWLLRRTDACRLALLGSLCLLMFQPGLYFFLPTLTHRLWGQSYYLHPKNLWAFGIRAITTAVLIVAIARYGGRPGMTSRTPHVGARWAKSED